MGRYVVKLPDIGEGMTEAEIVAWHVKPGQVVREEDPLVEIMTDKATVELPAPTAGTVLEIHGTPGERRPVGSELVVLDVAGAGNVGEAGRPDATAPIAAIPSSVSERTFGQSLKAARDRSRMTQQEVADRLGVARATISMWETDKDKPGRDRLLGLAAIYSTPVEELLGNEASWKTPGSVVAALQPEAAARPSLAEAPSSVARPSGSKPLASPAVRRRAWDAGIELQFVPGSGPGGRITQADLDAYLARGNGAAMPPQAARQDTVEDVPVIGLRRLIAERMQQAKRQIPHFSYVEETDVTALEELRGHLNASYPDRERLTLLPFLMRAIVQAAAAHPQVNARFDDAAGILHRHRAVHLGVATQTEGGLMVPVVRHAETLDLWQSAAELRRLTQAARAGKASREELQGSTITITSLGRLGGIAATPVINYPEVAIVGVNRIVERPVVHERQIAVRRMMNLSSSFDHRIVDGWEAASFIQRVKQLLEQPALLFIV